MLFLLVAATGEACSRRSRLACMAATARWLLLLAACVASLPGSVQQSASWFAGVVGGDDEAPSAEEVEAAEEGLDRDDLNQIDGMVEDLTGLLTLPPCLPCQVACSSLSASCCSRLLLRLRDLWWDLWWWSTPRPTPTGTACPTHQPWFFN